MVIAMFTRDFESQAIRLCQSLDSFQTPYSIYEVPSVHTSISSRGTGDLEFSKPGFILRAMEMFEMPVLYVDVDMVFRKLPVFVENPAGSATDFAVYNWLADSNNDAWVPVAVEAASGESSRGRYYAFSHTVDLYDERQLLCSGAVQYHSGSRSSRKLLDAWLETIRHMPTTSDDELLHYAFNLHRKSQDLNT